jgi:cysteine desulfurase
LNRVYLDWNATAPLRPEARAAMLSAMDVVGNPSSVHAEGRAAKAIVEKARGQVAALVGCEPGEVVFTSGATEAINIVASQGRPLRAADIEHDSVVEVASENLPVSRDGFVQLDWSDKDSIQAVQAANSETGVLQHIDAIQDTILNLVDAAQALGKVCLPRFDEDCEAEFVALSGHKIGAAKGTGALFIANWFGANPLHKGGGQEMGRRSGTENVIGIAGFGAAAEAARHDLENQVWDQVAKLRDSLEERLETAAPELHVFGKDVRRLPNTSCFAIPGWKGETQVMQMDLAGYAVSAGSACSSGKVNKASRVLLAMGYDEETASSAIRVSIGPTTTEAEVMGFADTWIEHYRRRRQRAA